ncbi:hypothetical protein LSG31_00190 [Fodinisporobacter ferrooxydans]|uniref:Uncharacterized protein n=1 Tax=Fodinisporobacter ferrooxydans TaxID=2901836 RepID=A0ABY4CMJ6_9BACL|nr:hypothetical protein LSG31_00190 [Alicyclobacillaceae bacterium MYW30-H2]
MKGWRRNKKPQISPYCPEWVHKFVHDLANYIRDFDGETARKVVMTSFNTNEIIGKLGPYFFRDYSRDRSIWCGHTDHRNLDEIILLNSEYNVRLHMRFSQEEWSELDELSFSLNRPIAHTTAALLILGLQDKQVICEVASGFTFFARGPYRVIRL